MSVRWTDATAYDPGERARGTQPRVWQLVLDEYALVVLVHRRQGLGGWFYTIRWRGCTLVDQCRGDVNLAQTQRLALDEVHGLAADLTGAAAELSRMAGGAT